MSSFVTQFLRAESGVSAVEFALVLPIALLLMMGAIDLGSMAWIKMQVSASARAGASYALSRGWSSTAVSTAVTSATRLTVTATPAPTNPYGCPNASTGISTAGVTSTTVCANGTTAGKYVIVGARADYDPLLNWPGLPNPVALSSTATVRIP